MTVTWAELDALVGGLPASAYDHAAFWKGDRSGWPGFTTVDVRVGRSVTFVRRSRRALTAGDQAESRRSKRGPVQAVDSSVDVVLVGCAKRKLDRPAPARELYTSPLFTKARAYAERRSPTWFVLSAEHGLVDPTTVIEPYDTALLDMSTSYREAWGERVFLGLGAALGSVSGRTIEILAGRLYVDPIRDRLLEAGASVLEPLAGLRQGERLAWLSKPPADHATPSSVGRVVVGLVAALTDDSRSKAPDEFMATRGVGLRHPGLYSWWVDADGADELARGLGHEVRPGLVYTGLAGATRSRSGRRSGNTLWGRITTMHLGGRHEFSTFRLSLGSALASAWSEKGIDEPHLTEWMREHLRVIAVPADDPDGLGVLEGGVLSLLDPPLNLSMVERTALRVRLTELRRTYSRKVRRPQGAIGADATARDTNSDIDASEPRRTRTPTLP